MFLNYPMPIERKLAAIMFTDIAGYTALSAKDENKALELLDTQKQILTPIIEEFNGTLHKEIGDGLLFTFPTVSEAVKCGIKIQEKTKANDDLNLRIGIHEGEITLKDGDALGDDVNVASRIEAFAPCGGIAISSKVQQNISSLPEFETSYVGKPELKGVAQEIKVYCITSHGLPKADEIVEPIIVESKSNFNIFTLTGGILTAIGISFWIAVGVFDVSFGGKTEVPSVGILMMENLGKEDDKFWARGITEDLIVKVAGAGLIRIATMKEILEVDIKQSFEVIAKKLRVKYLLVSSIYKKEDGFDLRCQLIDVESGNSKYANKWSESIDDAPAIVGNLADNILKSLKVSTKQEITKVSTANTEAYEYYLKAKYQYYKRENKEDTEIVKGLIEKAIELDDNLIEAKNFLGNLYEGLGYHKQSMEIYQKSLVQAEKLGNKRAIASSLIKIAYFNDISPIEDSLRLPYFQRALKIFEDLNDKKGIATALMAIGGSYSEDSNDKNYKISLDHMNRSLKIREELGDTRGVWAAYNNIGILYADMGDIDKEMEYFFRALSICEKSEDQYGIAFMYWNIGFTYAWSYYDYDKGLYYINKSVKINKELGDYEISSSGKMSGVYLGMGDYDTALQYLNEGLQYFEEQEWYPSVANVLTGIGIVYIERQQFDKAVTYLERAFSIRKDENQLPDKILPTAVLLALTKKNIYGHYNNDIIELIKGVNNNKEFHSRLIYRQHDEIIGFDINYYIYLLLENTVHLEIAYNQLQKIADNLEPDVAAKFLSYPIPSAIVEEWEKVK